MQSFFEKDQIDNDSYHVITDLLPTFNLEEKEEDEREREKKIKREVLSE